MNLRVASSPQNWKMETETFSIVVLFTELKRLMNKWYPSMCIFYTLQWFRAVKSGYSNNKILCCHLVKLLSLPKCFSLWNKKKGALSPFWWWCSFGIFQRIFKWFISSALKFSWGSLPVSLNYRSWQYTGESPSIHGQGLKQRNIICLHLQALGRKTRCPCQPKQA